MYRRGFLRMSATGLACAALSPLRAQSSQPNVVLIYADDLGYGDLGCYGSSIPTPNIDRLATEGVRFRNYYAASSVCSPSRAALLTGRYAPRVGVPGVLDPDSCDGLSLSQTTLADTLRGAGYKTACVGKWHLGSAPEYMPTRRGFDQYFGIPYSHDMWPRPLIRNTEVIEQPARLDTLTSRFTDEALSFVRRADGSPFFLYFAHIYPHIPLACSSRFRGKSGLGRYGDVMAELDWSVGEVLNVLKETGLDENTAVLFASDNGPWYQGSSGRLRGRKGETLDGGMREPLLARFPGRFAPGTVVDGLASALDIAPTVTQLCGASMIDQPVDGYDILPMLSGAANEIERDAFLYFHYWNIQCARLGNWKVHFSRYNTRAYSPDPTGGRVNLPLPEPELYNVEQDPGENYDRSDERPDIVADIRARIEALLPTFPNQVQDAWRDTMRRVVEQTPPGSLPVEHH